MGYVFLAVRNPKTKEWKDIPFHWPKDKEKITNALEQAKRSKNDVYWSPSVFSKPRRNKEFAKPTRALWADLDTVSYRGVHPKPSAVWESSPGKYQCLWLLPYRLSVDEHNKYNQRLTYAIGADKGGWDTTQVLRIPGTANHKYPEEPEVKLIRLNGHKTDPIDLEKLPALGEVQLDEIPESRKVFNKWRRKLPPKALQYLKATHPSPVGTRSERLWELECLLAETGLSVPEIVSLVSASVWDKFRDRADHFQRLATEAQRALEKVGVAPNGAQKVVTTYKATAAEEDVTTYDIEELEAPKDWATFDKDRKPINWLIAEVWGEGEVGFISGLPKAYKSWFSLDFAVSVATGTQFLDTFASKKKNVLLIQVEDPKAVLQDRLAKIGGSRGLLSAKQTDNSKIEVFFGLPDNLYIATSQEFSITEESHLEQLEQWIREREIGLVILDPLMMMTGGEVDEFKAFEFMSRVLKPLKKLRAKTNCAIVVIHHHTKTERTGGLPGQSMYGSVALWAWEEAGFHVSITGLRKVKVERFSKHAQLPQIHVEVSDTEQGWTPYVFSGVGESGLLDTLKTSESGVTIDELGEMTSMSRDALQRHLKKLIDGGKVKRERGESFGKGRPKWRFSAAKESE